MRSVTPMAREATIAPALRGNTKDMNENNEVQTAPVATAGQDQAPDVVSDPAKDDTEGQDWSDEGGATPAGPSTNDDKAAG